MNTYPLPEPDFTVDGTGLLCVTLLMKLRAHIRDAAPDSVVHCVATDPAAPLGLPAWCHMTGHGYLGPVPDSGRAAYALRLTAAPVATRRMLPGTGRRPNARWDRRHAAARSPSPARP